MSLKSWIFPCHSIYRCTRGIHSKPAYKNISRCLLRTANNLNEMNLRCFVTETNNTKRNNSIKQVYFGPLTNQIKAVKVFSLSSSAVGVISQPFLYNEIMVTGNVPMIVAAYSFIGFFTIVTPILLHFITKKYVTHLSYNEKTNVYIAKTLNFFGITKETEFKIDDVKVPDVPGMFTTLHARGKPLFLDPRMFDQPEHYARLMGYDKPIDFKMFEQGREQLRNK